MINFTGYAFPENPTQLLGAVQTPVASYMGILIALYAVSIYVWTVVEDETAAHTAELMEFVEDGGQVVRNLMAKNEKLDAENAMLLRENAALLARNAALTEELAAKRKSEKQLELARRAVAIGPRPERALRQMGWRQLRTGRRVRVVDYKV